LDPFTVRQSPHFLESFLLINTHPGIIPIFQVFELRQNQKSGKKKNK